MCSWNFFCWPLSAFISDYSVAVRAGGYRATAVWSYFCYPPWRVGTAMCWKCTRSWNEGRLPAAWTSRFSDWGLAVMGLQNMCVSVNHAAPFTAERDWGRASLSLYGWYWGDKTRLGKSAESSARSYTGGGHHPRFCESLVQVSTRCT